jgi:hypothetical protein
VFRARWRLPFLDLCRFRLRGRVEVRRADKVIRVYFYGKRKKGRVKMAVWYYFLIVTRWRQSTVKKCFYLWVYGTYYSVF